MKRNMINTSVTDEAKSIYDSLPPHRKGHWVSSAIVEKHERDTGTSLEQKVETLEQKVKHIEDVLERKGRK